MMYNKFLELFGVTEEDLKKLMDTALSEGGDYADLYFEHSIANELALRDKQVNAVGSHIDYGVGIRVISGDQTGYAYSEITTMPKMLEAARTAAKIANNNRQKYIAPQNITLLEGNNFYPIAKGWNETFVTDKIPYLYRLNEIAFGLDERVIKVSARISDSLTKILFCNSYGETYTDIRPMVSVICSCVMESNGKLENGSASRSFRMGFELIDDTLIDEIAHEAIRKTAFLFDA
ncbi:MAG: TldD/PmbA family protein, partial [Bacteroidales bacterium]|nr:TldD/PmbA family protein [Bacteroidales bacterium]